MRASALPPDLLTGERGVIPLVVPYEVGGRRERLVYLSREGDLAAYEELRAGFTAAVSHELRTPLARLLTLLETTALPGEDVPALVEQARGEIDQITELIDEVLFLSELESGARVVALGATPVRPVLEEAIDELAERAARAGRRAPLECDDDVELAIRPRMLRVVARNLAENAIRYAGPGATFTLDGRARRRRRRARRARRRHRRSRRPSFRGSSSASTAPIARGRRAGRASGSRSSSTSSRRPAARSRRGALAAAGSRCAASFPRRSPLHRIVTTSSPSGIPAPTAGRGDWRHDYARASHHARLHRGARRRRCRLRRRDDSSSSGDLITADGSSTVGPFATKAAEDWKASGGSEVTVGISGTGGGFERFCVGETDISNASRQIDEDEAAICEENGVEYVELRVATDALTNVVNLENDWASCLTVGAAERDLEAQVHGDELEPGRSVVSGRPAEALRRRERTRARSTTSPTSSTVRRARAARTSRRPRTTTSRCRASRATRAALGYFGFSYFEENQDKLKALEVDAGSGCVAPSVETAQNDTYTPLSRPLFMYVKLSSLADNESVSEFINYTLENAETIATEAQFVPLSQEQIDEQQQNLEDATA